MVVVVVFSMIFAAALFVLLARYATDPTVVRAEERNRFDRRPRISAAQLRSLVIELLHAMGLAIQSEEMQGEERRLLAVQRDAPLGGSRYVVFVVPSPPGDAVEQTTVLELAESVKGEHGAVGLLVTPYRIEVGGLGGMDVPLELIDGPRLRELVARHLPERIPELDRLRGFGSTVPLAPPSRVVPKPV